MISKSNTLAKGVKHVFEKDTGVMTLPQDRPEAVNFFVVLCVKIICYML